MLSALFTWHVKIAKKTVLLPIYAELKREYARQHKRMLANKSDALSATRACIEAAGQLAFSCRHIY